MLLGALIFVGLATAAAAKTVTFDFAATNSLGWAESLSYSKSGLTLTVSGKDTLNRAGKVQTWKGWGLGLKSVTDCRGGFCTGDDHQIDATGRQDIVNFAFSSAVRITGLTFNLVDAFDTFDFYTGGAKQFQAAVSPFAALNSSFGDSFGIGAGRSSRQVCSYPHVRRGGPVCETVWSFSAFKLTGMTVETASVPLPAAGLTLMAGLGALAAISRRRKAA